MDHRIGKTVVIEFCDGEYRVELLKPDTVGMSYSELACLFDPSNIEFYVVLRFCLMGSERDRANPHKEFFPIGDIREALSTWMDWANQLDPKKEKNG